MKKRRLGFVHMTALGINAIVGSGIFMVPGTLAKELGLWSVLAFAVSGLLLNFVALAFARLATLTDRSGGPYLYAELAFGKESAFVVGWIAWIAAVVSCGAVGNAIGFYLSHFFSVSPLEAVALTALVVVTFTVVNHFGVTYGGRTLLALTVLKLLPLGALAVGGCWAYSKNGRALFTAAPFSFAGISGALLMTLFSCQGFEAVPIIAGETDQPRKNVPKAILVSLWVSIALYTVAQVGILSSPAVGSAKPLADEAQFLWGRWGGDLVAAAGLVSVVGFVAGIVLAAPRFLTPLCEDGLLPRFLLSTHPRFGTPTWAIALTSLAILICSLSSAVEELIALSALSVAMQYLVSSLALLVLSWRARAKGLWIALGSTAVSVLFLSQVPARAWLVFAIMAVVGLVLRGAYALRQADGRASSPAGLGPSP